MKKRKKKRIIKQTATRQNVTMEKLVGMKLVLLYCISAYFKDSKSIVRATVLLTDRQTDTHVYRYLILSCKCLETNAAIPTIWLSTIMILIDAAIDLFVDLLGGFLLLIV